MKITEPVTKNIPIKTFPDVFDLKNPISKVFLRLLHSAMLNTIETVLDQRYS